MDFLEKAKELGRKASSGTAKAATAARDTGTKLRRDISDRLAPHVPGSGFGSVAIKALDKSAEAMLGSSVRLFNLVVRKLAEEPKYCLVTNPVQLEQLKSEVLKRGNDLNSHPQQELVKLRAVFSNCWETLDFGDAINSHLRGQICERVEAVKQALRQEDEQMVLNDPHVLAVIESLQADDAELDKLNDAELERIVTSVVSAEQHFFDQVYQGLKAVRLGNADQAEEILARVEKRQHYLVHSCLAATRREASYDRAIVNLETARACRASDVSLYDTEAWSTSEDAKEVLEECCAVLGIAGACD